MEFTQLSLHENLLKGVLDAGYENAMPVQEAVFAHSFSGKDIYAQSQTGSGKTAAFLVSMFQRILMNNDSKGRKALILAPTRELACQIEDEAVKLAKHTGIKAGSFYGGVGYGPQLEMLKNNVQVLIGTPGRVIDLVKQGHMMLGDVGFLVIDEADRMFDMGFIEDLRLLLKYLPPSTNRQTMLFSATLNVRVKNLAWEYMHEPEEIVIESETVTVDTITQELYHVGSDEKMPLMLGILKKEQPKSCIVFCNLKRTVEEIAKRLSMNGYNCEYIMGDLPQKQRQHILDKFKEGSLSMMVATDVAARGLDIEDLSMVINYDLPLEAENYVHRIGRTARAGKKGKAITFACEKYVYGLRDVEKYIERSIPVIPVDVEMFAEDASKNMRIHRDFHDTNARSSGGHNQKRPEYKKNTSHTEKRPYDKNRTASTSAQGSVRNKNVSDQNYKNSTSRNKPVQKAVQESREISAKNRREKTERPESLYAMSMEERLAMYKKKYGQAADAQKPSTGEKGRPAKPFTKGKASTTPKGSATPKPFASAKNGSSKDTKRTDSAKRGVSDSKVSRARPNTVSEQTRGQNTKASNAPEKKSGILGFIAALFQKKGE